MQDGAGGGILGILDLGPWSLDLGPWLPSQLKGEYAGWQAAVSWGSWTLGLGPWLPSQLKGEYAGWSRRRDLRDLGPWTLVALRVDGRICRILGILDLGQLGGIIRVTSGTVSE